MNSSMTAAKRLPPLTAIAGMLSRGKLFPAALQLMPLLSEMNKPELVPPSSSAPLVANVRMRDSTTPDGVSIQSAALLFEVKTPADVAANRLASFAARALIEAFGSPLLIVFQFAPLSVER